MSLNSLRKKTEGFTIIEVLIVLAIAGLILLIVFLAVPALQRNSRNTRRVNDVSRLGGAVSEFSNNNNGKIPTGNANLADILDNAGTLSQYTITWNTQNDTVTGPIGIFVGTQGALPANNQQFQTNGTNATSIETIRIVTGAICDTNTPGATTATGATSRNVSIQFAVEGATTPVPRCQEV